MTWTRFMDMHSGGGQKLEWDYIYIEAPQEEAEIIFQNRWGRNPNRVTCTCCGEDYSISEEVSLQRATGYDRACRCLKTPRDPKTGLYRHVEDPAFDEHYYLEEGEVPPPGYEVEESRWSCRAYQTLEEYTQKSDVLIIYADDIKPGEREGSLEIEGYVWK